VAQTREPAAPEAQAILDFWFLPEDDPRHGTTRNEWFRKNPAFDALIRERFGAFVEQALAGAFPSWDEDGRGAVARILLLDQFPRNLFRKQPEAFAGDGLALAAAEALLARQADQALPPIMRVFAYLPFEHAESPAAQERSVACFEALAARWPEAAGYLDYARRHRAVIARFGRFPHRNEILGRASTPEERVFLRGQGSRF